MRPTNTKEVQCFLGHLEYISKFLPGYTTVAQPLYHLLKKGVRFDWTDACEHSFNKLKKLEAAYMSLNTFQQGLPVKITTDASNVAVGAVLWQQFGNEWRHVMYRSVSLTASQRNWSTLDKEFYAIRIVARKFKFYINQVKDVYLETDPEAILSIVKKVDLTIKHARWLGDLIGLNLIVKHISGEKNEVADYLSRIPTDHLDSNARQHNFHS